MYWKALREISRALEIHVAFTIEWKCYSLQTHCILACNQGFSDGGYIYGTNCTQKGYLFMITGSYSCIYIHMYTVLLKKQTYCFHSVWMLLNENFTLSVNINCCMVMGTYEAQSSKSVLFLVLLSLMNISAYLPVGWVFSHFLGKVHLDTDCRSLPLHADI